MNADSRGAVQRWECRLARTKGGFPSHVTDCEDAGGRYVLYADHAAAIAELREHNTELLDFLDAAKFERGRAEARVAALEGALREALPYMRDLAHDDEHANRIATLLGDAP